MKNAAIQHFMIAVQGKHSIKTIYCHQASSYSEREVDEILKKYYNSYSLAQKLIKQGNLISLKEDYVSTYFLHDNRDWKECKPKICQDMASVIALAIHNTANTLCLYSDNTWKIMRL
ncbi:hypothetical protein [Agarilytica rhodophyticola]|uniref:hypothetical protein n=1 Tax=Agarilytica rhodophyticola TaxID=1737490 RepID=UPI000B344E48|nr:hypothetical protein [Agarilytica rhodophyticola]